MKKVRGNLRKLDMFPQEARLQSTYKTSIGGFFTIIALVAILGFGIYQLINQLTEPYKYDFKQFERPIESVTAFPFRETEFLAGITLKPKNSADSVELSPAMGRFFIMDQTTRAYPTEQCYTGQEASNQQQASISVGQGRRLQDQTWPDPPKNLSVQYDLELQQVYFTWEDGDFDGGSPIASYMLLMSKDGLSDASGNDPFRDFQTVPNIGYRFLVFERNLEMGKTYYFGLFAKNQNGAQSQRSNYVELKIGRLPASPQITSAIQGQKIKQSLTIDWVIEEDELFPILDYSIYYNFNNDRSTEQLIAQGVTAMSYTITDLEFEKRYIFYVKARNEFGFTAPVNSFREVYLEQPYEPSILDYFFIKNENEYGQPDPLHDVLVALVNKNFDISQTPFINITANNTMNVTYEASIPTEVFTPADPIEWADDDYNIFMVQMGEFVEICQVFNIQIRPPPGDDFNITIEGVLSNKTNGTIQKQTETIQIQWTQFPIKKMGQRKFFRVSKGSDFADFNKDEPGLTDSYFEDILTRLELPKQQLWLLSRDESIPQTEFQQKQSNGLVKKQLQGEYEYDSFSYKIPYGFIFDPALKPDLSSENYPQYFFDQYGTFDPPVLRFIDGIVDEFEICSYLKLLTKQPFEIKMCQTLQVPFTYQKSAYAPKVFYELGDPQGTLDVTIGFETRESEKLPQLYIFRAKCTVYDEQGRQESSYTFYFDSSIAKSINLPYNDWVQKDNEWVNEVNNFFTMTFSTEEIEKQKQKQNPDIPELDLTNTQIELTMYGKYPSGGFVNMKKKLWKQGKSQDWISDIRLEKRIKSVAAPDYKTSDFDLFVTFNTVVIFNGLTYYAGFYKNGQQIGLDTVQIQCPDSFSQESLNVERINCQIISGMEVIEQEFVEGQVQLCISQRTDEAGGIIGQVFNLDQTVYNCVDVTRAFLDKEEIVDFQTTGQCKSIVYSDGTLRTSFFPQKYPSDDTLYLNFKTSANTIPGLSPREPCLKDYSYQNVSCQIQLGKYQDRLKSQFDQVGYHYFEKVRQGVSIIQPLPENLECVFLNTNEFESPIGEFDNQILRFKIQTNLGQEFSQWEVLVIDPNENTNSTPNYTQNNQSYSITFRESLYQGRNYRYQNWQKNWYEKNRVNMTSLQPENVNVNKLGDRTPFNFYTQQDGLFSFYLYAQGSQHRIGWEPNKCEQSYRICVFHKVSDDSDFGQYLDQNQFDEFRFNKCFDIEYVAKEGIEVCKSKPILEIRENRFENVRITFLENKGIRIQGTDKFKKDELALTPKNLAFMVDHKLSQLFACNYTLCPECKEFTCDVYFEEGQEIEVFQWLESDYKYKFTPVDLVAVYSEEDGQNEKASVQTNCFTLYYPNIPSKPVEVNNNQPRKASKSQDGKRRTFSWYLSAENLFVPTGYRLLLPTKSLRRRRLSELKALESSDFDCSITSNLVECSIDEQVISEAPYNYIPGQVVEVVAVPTTQQQDGTDPEWIKLTQTQISFYIEPEPLADPVIGIKEDESDQNKVSIAWNSASASQFKSIRMQIRLVSEDNWNDITLNGWANIVVENDWTQEGDYYIKKYELADQKYNQIIKVKNGAERKEYTIEIYPLTAGEQYSVRLKAKDSTGLNTNWSNREKFIAVGKINSVQGVEIGKVDFGNDQVLITWKQPTKDDLNGNKVLYYHFYVSTKEDDEDSKQVQCRSFPSETSCALGINDLVKEFKLVEQSDFFVQIQIIGNNDINSDNSTAVKSKYVTPPKQPTQLNIKAIYEENTLIKLQFKIDDASRQKTSQYVLSIEESENSQDDNIPVLVLFESNYDEALQVGYIDLQRTYNSNPFLSKKVYLFKVAFESKYGRGTFSESIKWQRYSDQAPILSNLEKGDDQSINLMWKLPLSYQYLVEKPEFQVVVRNIAAKPGSKNKDHKCIDTTCYQNYDFVKQPLCKCQITSNDFQNEHAVKNGDFVQFSVYSYFPKEGIHDQSLRSQVLDAVWGQKQQTQQSSTEDEQKDTAQVIEDNFTLILENQIQDQIFFLEKETMSPNYNPTNYQKDEDQKQLEKLKNMKANIPDLVKRRTGGVCPAKELTIQNVREKCTFDFVRYGFQIDMIQDFYNIEECMKALLQTEENQENINKWISSKHDLMIKTDPVQNEHQSIDYAYFPCNQDLESSLQSGVICDTETSQIDEFQKSKNAVTLWWMQQLIVKNTNAIDMDAYKEFTQKDDEDKFAYKLYPMQQQEQQSEIAEDKTVIIRMKFQYKKFFMLDRKGDNLKDPEAFGTLEFSDRETITRKKNSAQPLVIFRIEYQTSELVTEVTQIGEPLMNLIIETLSFMGGLFPIFFGNFAIVVAILAAPGFVAYLSQNLFLVKKFEGKESSQNRIVPCNQDNDLQKQISGFGLAELEEKNISRNPKVYYQLKQKIEEGQIDKDDIENITSEMLDQRYPMRVAQHEKRYRLYFLPRFVSKCLYKRSEYDTYGYGRVQQAKRKLEKIQNVPRILRALHKSELIQHVMLSGNQKLLAKFQRFSLIEEEDITESSAEVEEYLDPQNRKKVQAQLNKLKQIDFNDPQHYLTKVLLKGVFTSNNFELDREPELGKQKTIKKKEEGSDKNDDLTNEKDSLKNDSQNEDDLDNKDSISNLVQPQHSARALNNYDSKPQPVRAPLVSMFGNPKAMSKPYNAPEMKDFSQQFSPVAEVGVQNDPIVIKEKESIKKETFVKKMSPPSPSFKSPKSELNAEDELMIQTIEDQEKQLLTPKLSKESLVALEEPPLHQEQLSLDPTSGVNSEQQLELLKQIVATPSEKAITPHEKRKLCFPQFIYVQVLRNLRKTKLIPSMRI